MTEIDLTRITELLTAERTGTIEPEERAELETLLDGLDSDAARARVDEITRRLDNTIGDAIIALDALDGSPGMPAGAKRALAARGGALVRAKDAPAAIPLNATNRRSRAGWYAAAASILVGVAAVGFLWSTVNQKEQSLNQIRLASEQRAETNQQLLADARAEADRLGSRLSAIEARNIDLVTRLADATSKAESFEQRIAEYERPRDPALLEQKRRQLLDVNGTIRVAWQPFDVPGLPETEQAGVEGDVVWNDDLQEGYLRFVGLKVNNPDEEQYQVWVIDERGMEQKVSGGVFDATESGDLIVPIEPGIDVGNVQVFAITVEEPGGIWVPDLRRRVVVAPRPGDG